MRSLHIDFTNYNGHQMVISGKEDIRRNDLHELELNMISDNTIRILLPMSCLRWMIVLALTIKLTAFA